MTTTQKILGTAAAVAFVAGVVYVVTPKGSRDAAPTSVGSHPSTLNESAAPVELPADAKQGAPVAAGPVGGNAAATTPPLPQGGVARRHALEELGWELASEDPAAALARLAEFTKPVDREAFLRGVFEWAAQQGVEAALALTRQLERRPDREMAMMALLRAWSGLTDHGLATQFDRSTFDSPAGMLGWYLLDAETASPAQVAQLAQDFLAGSKRATLLGAAAGKMAAQNPAQAFALGDSLAGDDQTEFLRRFAAGWAEKDPAAAWAWAAQLPDEATRSQLRASIVEVEAAQNFPAALAHFQTLPAQSAARVRAAEHLAAEWAGRDTAAAQQWLGSITDAQEHAAAARGFEQGAPGGIGVALGMGSDGVALVNDLIPGGAASRSGGLRPGDRIVGVTDATGQWLDARQIPLIDLVGLMRGRPGSTISLRVLSAGAASTTAPREVAVPRQRLVNLRGNAR